MLFAASLAVGLSAAACGSSAATVAPPPATPTVTVTDTPIPTDTPLAATPTPTPTPKPTPTPTAAPTPTPAPTATPTPAPSGSATPSPTPLPSASCTGGAATKQWLVDQIPHFKFKLYCAVMPSGWSLVGMAADYNVPGIQAHYKNNKTGGIVDIWEGNVCGLSPNPCSGSWPTDYGPQAFGPLTGTLTGDGGSEAWSNVVTTPDPKVRYVITGNWFDIVPFKAISAAMHPLS